MSAVYLDHNATTPLRPEAREALLEALELGPLNASSAHGAGRTARALLDEARERVAEALGVGEEEILFTSGGTEALNLAVAGTVGRKEGKGHVAASAVEHPAVLAACERYAGTTQVIGVLEDGAVRVDELPREADLVAIQAANSETGTVQDLPAVRAALPDSPLLVDAVQALGKIPIDLNGWGADLAGFSAHKVGGPAGVGVLVRRPGRGLEPLLVGGGRRRACEPARRASPPSTQRRSRSSSRWRSSRKPLGMPRSSANSCGASSARPSLASSATDAPRAPPADSRTP